MKEEAGEVSRAFNSGVHGGTRTFIATRQYMTSAPRVDLGKTTGGCRRRLATGHCDTLEW